MAKNKAIVLLPAIFTKMTPKVDKSWKLELVTRELQGDEVRVMAERLGTEGYWANSPNSDVEAADIPDTEADSGMEGKSPSQRLRNVLYRVWESNGSKGSFEVYRAAQIEKIIDALKEKLNDE